MRAIMILISHNHYRSIAKIIQISTFSIHFSNFKTYDLNKILDFWVFHNLFTTSFSNIQEFTSKWKYSIFISAYNFNAS